MNKFLETIITIALFIFVMPLCIPAQNVKALPIDKNKPVVEGRAVEVKEVYSSVFDIKNYNRFYILAKSKDSKLAIIEALKNEESLEFIEEPLKAQFFLDYRESAEGGELRAFYFKENAIVIVWAENSPKKASETTLTKEFLKVFKRNQALK